ncbi:molybdopterin synthase catalytic subunit MoaE [Candidatus Puniceispirillum sp.]|jgi:molybdopterin synthase catalytic subunit|uniref:molybdopterin synthase catalytic subunit MoaE n=1 Tax=Candidatus Puniceispirillum sp. TaxID=2026719 RepID=UPI002FCDE652
MGAVMDVRITEADFDIAAEHDALKARAVGAIVTFTGTVRGDDDGAEITALTLEHFPGMTEAEITTIIETARDRWSLAGVTVIHRVGRLLPEDNIVFVGVAAAHRDAAFSGASFIMDYLKTKAPFWKKAEDKAGESWVEARLSDDVAADRWDETD